MRIFTRVRAFWGEAPTLILLVLAIFSGRILSLGLYPLSDNTESRYAEIARRMTATSDWVTLWLPNNIPFWGKPPLSTWVSASGIGVFGPTEWGARAPVMAVAFAATYLTYQWAKRQSVRAGILAVASLWGSAVFVISAGAVMTDLVLMFSVLLALSGFWRAVDPCSDGQDRKAGLASLFIGLAAGLLAKGPVSTVLTVLPIACYALSGRSQLQAVRALPWIRGSLITIMIAMPWYVMANLKTPGFLEYFFVGEHWKRFTQPGWSGDLYGTAHLQPRGTIWLFMAIGWMPWTLLIPLLFWGRRTAGNALTHAVSTNSMSSPDNVLLLAWVLSPLLFFTLSRNILWTYVLPSAPAVAILMARWLAADTRRQLVNSVVSAGLMINILLFGALLQWQADKGGIRSAKNAVRALQGTGHPLKEAAFLHAVPYSATFYSAGAIERAVDLATLEQWQQESPALHHHHFIMASQKDWDALMPEQRNSYQTLSTGGGYVLAAPSLIASESDNVMHEASNLH